MASSRLQAFRRTVTVDWPKDHLLGAKRHLIRVARAGHNDIMAEQRARSGANPSFTFYANTPGNTNLESVILPGPIVYKYQYFEEIIQAIMEDLRRSSPVQSGAYVQGHTLFINGEPVPDDRMPPYADGMDIFIANTVPYARRIEVGKTTSGRAFVIQVAPHIYERVAKRAQARFGNIAGISHGYASIPKAHTIKGRLPSHYIAKGGVRRRRRQVVGSSVQAPAIFINPR